MKNFIATIQAILVVIPMFFSYLFLGLFGGFTRANRWIEWNKEFFDDETNR